MNATGPDYFESRGRAEKAIKLARFMYREMLTVATEADDETWQSIAAKAGVNVPSAETRALVIEILKGKEPKE